MLPGLIWFIVDLFYAPAYFFFGAIATFFQITGADPHDVTSCQVASILYIPVWLIIFTLIYYSLHRAKLFERQLQLVSRYRHVFLGLYIFIVLWMYSIPVGCENVWEIMPEGFFMHRGLPLQFAGAALESAAVVYPFINLFYTEIPTHKVVWYIPNMLMNLAVITGVTYLTYWALKHLPFHIHKHRAKRAKKSK